MVRHGEVMTPGLLCAASDEPLSKRGHQQLASLGSAGGWDIIISSPSLRCREFAEQLSDQYRIPLLVDSAWREIDMGEWTGRTTQSIWQSDRDHLLKLWESPQQFIAPGGEQMTGFIDRVHRATDALIADHRGKTILLLTHAGVIRAILAQILSMEWRSVQKIKMGHGKINRLCAYPDGEFSLLKLGCSPAELA